MVSLICKSASPRLALLLVATLALAPTSVFAQATPPDQGPPAAAQQQTTANTSATTVEDSSVNKADKKSKRKDKKKKDKDKNKSADATDQPVDKPLPGVAPGSIDDVNAVGNRNIGGRGLGNWYSTDSEIKMGRQYAAEIEKSTRFITDPVINEYVNRVGQNIVRNSDAKVPFTIKVIDSDEINAMALPGGFFYVNSGLILAADDEAEMAGVMAHEIAHVAAHHAARELTRMNYAQIGSIPLIMMTGYSMTGYGIYEATQLAIPIAFLQFSREFESQADFLGVQYMYRAGYDPEAFVAMFEKIENLEKQKPGVLSKAFSSHPQTPDRIQHTQEEIARYLPARPEYMVTTSEFDDVKARLARIENKRKLVDKRKGNKPTLRRTSTTDPNNPNGQPPSNRPTLSRRTDN